VDFGGLSLTLVDSSNAQLSGGLVTFVGSTNSFNDGFAAAISGVFGPSNPLVFTYTTSVPFESVGFTVSAVAVPEPSSMSMAGVCIAITFMAWTRHRRRLIALA
jgi:PEP-CTERM motif-containing protein